MEQTEILLKDYTDVEKGAYFGAIASLATADHVATEDELEHLSELAESAGLSSQQQEMVRRAATEISDTELRECLQILKTSELRFSLIADLISFGESDKNYTAEEKANVEKIAQQLGINQKQFSLLDQFVKKTAETGKTSEEISQPGFLSSLGLDDKFKSAGINMGSLTKGLLGVAGPMILAGLLSGGMRRNRMGGNALGMGGGNSFGMGGGGGIGSLISMLNGGRGFNRTGGLLSKILRG